MIIASKRPRLVVSPKMRNKFSAPHRNTGGRRLSVNKRLTNAVAKASAAKIFAAASAAVGMSVDPATQRGNIRVVVRVRPTNDRESVPAYRTVVVAVDDKLILFDPKEQNQDFYFHGVKQTGNRDMLKKPHRDLKFCFDQVYGPQHNNENIFAGTVLPIIDTILNGFNCSVFAYGATGAGKTYTMLGSKENPGLTFLTVMELYRRLAEMNNDYEAEVAVSYLEVYNETVRDLLPQSESSGPLNVREDSTGVVIPGLSMHKPTDASQLLNMLAYGNSVRSQHPTDQNSESSRSHAVFQVFITLRGRFTDKNSNYKAAKLVMVDLAGSERGAATGFHGTRFREGASINKSLLALGNCINALADGKRHIPYRDSKLTRILKDALGGNCKTVMIANVGPSDISYDDTYNTLKYADRAKRIRFQVKKNIMSVSACISKYGKVIEEMTSKIEQLSKQLEEKERNCRCSCPKLDCGTELSNSFWEFDAQPEESHVSLQNHNHHPNFNDTVTLKVDAPCDPIFNNTVTLKVDAPCDPICNNTVILNVDTPSDPTITSGITSGVEIQASHGPTSSILTPVVALDTIEVQNFLQLLEKKRIYDQDCLKATNAFKEAERKYTWKDNRIKLAEAIGYLDISHEKGLEKMRRQLDNCLNSKSVLEGHVRNNNERAKQLDEAVVAAKEMLSVKLEDPFITITLNEFLHYRDLQQQVDANNLAASYLEKVNGETTNEALNASNLLGRTMSLLQPLYKIVKHTGQATMAMEADYHEIMSSLCGTKVRFISHVNSPSATAKRQIQDSTNLLYEKENQNFE